MLKRSTLETGTPRSRASATARGSTADGGQRRPRRKRLRVALMAGGALILVGGALVTWLSFAGEAPRSATVDEVSVDTKLGSLTITYSEVTRYTLTSLRPE